jgi:hypothetical protein
MREPDLLPDWFVGGAGKRRLLTALLAALKKMTREEERHQLARQLHITGNVARRKHAWLQAALGFFAVASALLVLAFVAF